MSFWNVLRSFPPGIAHNGKDPRRVINTPAFHLENVPSVPYCLHHMVLIESSWTDLWFSLTYAMNYYTEKHYKECPFIWIPGSWIVFFFFFFWACKPSAPLRPKKWVGEHLLILRWGTNNVLSFSCVHLLFCDWRLILSLWASSSRCFPLIFDYVFLWENRSHLL